MIKFLKKHRSEILIILSWLSVSAVYFYSMLMFILNNNMFSWGFKHDLITYISLAVTLIMLLFMYLLAMKTKGIFSQLISFVIALLFAILTVVSLLPDNDSLLRSISSPLLFRMAVSGLYIIPLLIWLTYPYRYFKVQRNT